MKEVKMPTLGVAMEEGLLVRWLKAIGDHCSEGEAIAEIETDKLTMEMESPAEGWVLELCCAEGETVPVGTVIARLAEVSDRRTI